MRRASSTCSGSPPCDAHARASASSPHPRSSNAVDSSSGITWNGLAHDRQTVTRLMSPLSHTTRSLASTTTAWTRWWDSTRSPRVATTSRSSCITNRRVLGNDRGAGDREDDTAQHKGAADERERRRHFANTGDERRNERGADGFAERGHVHHVRGQVLEGPVE